MSANGTFRLTIWTSTCDIWSFPGMCAGTCNIQAHQFRFRPPGCCLSGTTGHLRLLANHLTLCTRYMIELCGRAILLCIYTKQLCTHRPLPAIPCRGNVPLWYPGTLLNYLPPVLLPAAHAGHLTSLRGALLLSRARELPCVYITLYVCAKLLHHMWGVTTHLDGLTRNPYWCDFHIIANTCNHS